MGANAPNDETLKRRFIAGLRDPTAQQHINLTRSATLIDTKEQARLWEEVQLCQQRKMELLYEPMGGQGNISMKDPGQGSPALTTPASVAAASMPGKGQGGDYPRGVTRDQRRDGPIQCWRCHGFGHTQSRCPNEKKPVDYTPLCRYCSGEGHFDEDSPFPERLRAPKCRKERQSLEEVDIVKLLADTEVTLDIGTLLKCSPAYRKQFYNEYIKKPRKARDKKRQDKDVQGIIQSITMQIDSNAPAVTVEIKGYAVPGAQLDSGATVNLMTEYMMKALGLYHMEETPMSLRMEDQTQVKPAGLLKNVSIVVGGLEFKVDYLIVRPRISEATFSILLGRPWLVQAECVHDWHTGSITIGPKVDRIQLQVSPNLTDKKSTTTEEREQKAKEKVRQEMVRVRFALRTETSKDLS
ncbi:hypothetical protein KP509_02G008700 [Ceratopteris richardii]|uniref:CCHC-type domain-containing protein n=1 Tax=Ceratopteris richardii TaxID=49495 RepID=A0A8T2V3C1_CERRI|nr:hypothetical protein KP509_02G008700 [Ceratopteris richardii]